MKCAEHRPCPALFDPGVGPEKRSGCFTNTCVSPNPEPELLPKLPKQWRPQAVLPSRSETASQTEPAGAVTKHLGLYPGAPRVRRRPRLRGQGASEESALRCGDPGSVRLLEIQALEARGRRVARG